jgi:hypothetical protein
MGHSALPTRCAGSCRSSPSSRTIASSLWRWTRIVLVDVAIVPGHHANRRVADGAPASVVSLGCGKRLIHVSRACCTELRLHPSAWATASPMDATAWGPEAAWVSANKDVRVGVSAGGRCMGCSCHRAVQRDAQRDAGQPLRAPHIPAPEWDAGARSVSPTRPGGAGRASLDTRVQRATAACRERPGTVRRGAHPRHPNESHDSHDSRGFPGEYHRSRPPVARRRVPSGVDGQAIVVVVVLLTVGAVDRSKMRRSARARARMPDSTRLHVEPLEPSPRATPTTAQLGTPAGRVGVVGCATRGSVACAGCSASGWACSCPQPHPR